MRRIFEAIAVEGRYDKNTLSQVVDAVIIELGGFRIFTDRERLALLRRLAKTRGLIVFMDSDAAGLKIRNYLKSAIEPSLLKHAYIPDIAGIERRKSSPSKEGKLGVEGMCPEILIRSLEHAGASFDDASFEPGDGRVGISKADLYAAGLSGKADSALRRKELLRELELPENLSANALLEILNILMDLGEFQEKVSGIIRILDTDGTNSG